MNIPELTNDQQEFLYSFSEFINDDNTNVFILKGFAGTGKTFLIDIIAQKLNEAEHPFRLMAPTGRAAKIIAEKTKENAFTIHKTIYSYDDVQTNKNLKKKFKYYYKIRYNDDKPITLYIVDEASMVSPIKSEAEFFRFGSGELLKDFFSFAFSDGMFNKRKVLFVGDPAQLPPIGTELSPALDKDYLESNYELNCVEATLTEVVRQAKDSIININANFLRSSMEQDDYSNFNLITDGEEIIEIESDELLDTYLNVNEFSLNDNSMIISLSNKQSQIYNLMVRSYFFEDKKDIAIGDKVIVTTNNYNYDIELLNGDFGEVVGLTDDIEYPEEPIYIDSVNPVTRKSKKKMVDLRFRDIKFRFQDLHGVPHEFNCKVIDNLINSYQRDITTDERKALYKHFLMRNPSVKPGSKRFNELLGEDQYFNALRIKFGYAITLHKAQGGEWDNIFIDMLSFNNYRSKDYFRWLYTAITRAKSKVYILNKPYNF